ncbi:hypothetical protein TrRE_jg457 [Triparma retinervis]|uniref:Calcineurin-like phosphoesterase domain-containing protein n=1 Tax=Triparma retinervis TaxID=2557542 RepID=A0A9W7AQP8_9STRA|nr:hypothetical protein TrRE_jg457 [Triparma retinervis]
MLAILFLLLSAARADEPSQVEVEGVVSDCTAKSATSCFSCVTTPQSTYFGKVVISTPCRWCPATQECHAYGSLYDSCSIPIHTSDVEDTDFANYVCEAAKYPHVASDFSNTDIDALEQWVIQYIDNFKGEKHAFPSYEGTGDTGVYEISDKVSIAVASDWGSGTIESAAVASLMGKHSPDHTIHMGDVYYESLEAEIKHQVFGEKPNEFQEGVTFPRGKDGTWFLNANHEMLSLGNGYFDTLLPEGGMEGGGGQKASYFELENKHWKVIGLDTGYNSYATFSHIDAIDELKETDSSMEDELVKWLNTTAGLGEACAEDDRGIILLSHHQPFSDFIADDAYLGPPEQLSKMIPADCKVVWITGHEHQFSMYDLTTKFGTDEREVELSVYHRLVGNGGFPQPAQTPSKHTTLGWYDNRMYKSFPLNQGGEEGYVYNGYFIMALQDDMVTIEYYTFECESGTKSGDGKSCDRAVGPSMEEEVLLAREVFRAGGGKEGVELVDSWINEDAMTKGGEGGMLKGAEKVYRQRHAFQNGQKH